ncbi:MAG: transposase [Planctomycetes bacterium]|nr:transposase [Planctomycetota bacterium]
MPRPVRLAPADFCYHVINRGNGRAEVFHKPDDYAAFLRILSLACERHDMRLLAWCLMPNHFHFVVWPRRDGDLPRMMQWLTTCHVRRYHRHNKGSGHVWQGRYKSFIAEGGRHLLAVLKYVERNPVRAGLVKRSEHWPWSSVAAWAENGSGSRRVPDPLSAMGTARESHDSRGGQAQVSAAARQKLSQTPGRQTPVAGKGSGTSASLRSQTPFPEPDPISADPPIEQWLQRGPTPRPSDWLRWVNGDEEAELLARLRECVNRGAPFGNATWRENAARKLGLESSLRPRGRPPRRKEK